jgi:hypothetical protein
MFLNFNHDNHTKRNFYNVFAYYIIVQNTDKLIVEETTNFDFTSYDAKIYLCKNNTCKTILKNTNILQKKIEMIFNLYGICNFYCIM